MFFCWLHLGFSHFFSGFLFGVLGVKCVFFVIIFLWFVVFVWFLVLFLIFVVFYYFFGCLFWTFCGMVCGGVFGFVFWGCLFFMIFDTWGFTRQGGILFFSAFTVFSAANMAILVLVSCVADPMWGVRTTFFSFSRGLAGFIGSSSNTSSAAPLMLPSVSAS